MDKETYNECNHEYEITLYDLWHVIKKRWLIIFLISVFSLGLATYHALTAPEVYKVSNLLLLNQMQDGDIISNSEVSAAVSILNKDKGQNIINTGEVSAVVSTLSQAKDKNMIISSINRDDLKKIISINTSEIKGSTALWVDIDAVDKQAGVAVMEALPDYIFLSPNINSQITLQKEILQKNRDDLKAIIDNPRQQLKLSGDTVVYLPSLDLYNLREKYNRINIILEKINGRQFISHAWKTVSPTTPYKPKKDKIILVGLTFGILFGVLCAFFVEWVKSESYTNK